MKTYISLLRGINVTGYRKISMVELKACYESIELQKVTTYIQSGNVLFQSNKTVEILQQTITEAIKKTFGYPDVTIFVYQPEELQRLFANHPFTKHPEADLKKIYYTFLKDTPETEKVEALQTFQTQADQFKIIDNVVYIFCTNGYGDTKLTNNFFESKLKVRATTRNWNTVNKLLALSDNY